MALSEEAKKARARYMREWRKKHPEKVKEYEERKWEKKAREFENGCDRVDKTSQETN